jgi:teichuronic acid exporter
MSFRAQVLSAFRWSAGAKIVSQLVTWALTLLVIRLLTPADYGLVAMATLFVGLLGMLAEAGLGPVIVQAQTLDRRLSRQIFGLVLVIHFSVFLALVAAAPFIAAFFAQPSLTPMVQVLAVQFLVWAFAVMPSALLTRNLAFRGQSLIELSGALVGGATSLVLALQGFGAWALVISSIVLTVWRTIGLNLVAPYLERPVFALAGMRGSLAFGGSVTAARLLWYVSSQADIFIGGKFLGKELLGYYAVAMHLASLPVQKMSGISNQVVFPAFARIQTDPQSYRAYLLRAIHLLSLVSVPVLWGISAVAPELVDVFLGEKWRPASVTLQLLGLVMPLRIVGVFMATAVQGLGHADILLRNSLAYAIVMPIAFLIGVRWGLVGLALAWVIAMPLVFASNCRAILGRLGISWGAFLDAISRPMLIGAAMYGAVAGARQLLAPVVGGPALLLAALVAVGAIVYVACCLALDRAGVRELAGLVGNG